MGKKKGPKSKKKHESDEENEVETNNQEEEKKEEAVKVEEEAEKKEETPKPTEPSAYVTAKMDDKKYPIIVEYCKVCSLPIEFCEFSDRWVKCQEYLETAFPEKLKELIELRENDKNKNKVINKKVAAEARGEESQSGKKKKELEHELVVTVTNRGKRKHVSTITGTEHFNIDANALAKTLKKKFATGASVVNKPELGVELQGEPQDDLFEILKNEYKVPAENIYLVQDKKKTKYYS